VEDLQLLVRRGEILVGDLELGAIGHEYLDGG